MKVGILTISDRVSSGRAEDGGGRAVEEALPAAWEVESRAVVPDNRDEIESVLRSWADAGLDLILTTGGTGLGPRDVTPEATLAVADRTIPGIAEAMRVAAVPRVPTAMLSRAVAAVRGSTIIVNLPGSPRGAVENLQVVAPVLDHALHTLHGGGH